MGKFSRRVSEVAGWTMASRVLGLARDVLLFASLGSGPLNSAFILAFTIPNLFRRLLGEGALTSSSIPVLASSLEKDGQEQAFSLLNAIMVRLGLGLLLLQVVAIPLFWGTRLIPGLPERWYLASDLSLILFPYMFFICLGALVCGMLNVLGRFGLAALNQAWLNIAMISAILAGLFFVPMSGWQRVVLISAGVLLGGALQLLVPLFGLVQQGWRPRLGLDSHPELSKVMRLFLPGLLGAAIFQINILVSRFLAFSLDDTATGLLYISSRLVELPLGVFAIAITTVVFPELSRLSSSGSEDGFQKVFTKGLSLIFMITLPAALGLILLAEPILGFLFEWGLFESGDVRAAGPVLMAAACGLPFFAWSTLLTRAWYARQEMRTPVLFAAVNLFLNLFLGLILMRIYGAVGLALSNTLSSLVHCLALQAFLPGRSIKWKGWQTPAILLLGLSALSALAVFGQQLIQELNLPGKLEDSLIIFVLIPLAAGSYFLVLWFLRHPALKNLLRKAL
ncbi:murein biosynthesis integral membrane protein MurJ [Puniceicoccales bacterium CK1056]|uniref:Probable lipid II flippase MurJ n=1 Tax=Oceanipulchritudo coccoides TaxID=2706888 RepID=A0A6B2M5R6_9BACT|nr:murein biosynthesis integral membrane protein MurJ [Oceanipulchritudo coccoides]NDV63499.1 murein biosynthesis integral membrane protein MurJ [Oceanipulchritudo coccoides]